jgi:hypothetical protein
MAKRGGLRLKARLIGQAGALTFSPCPDVHSRGEYRMKKKIDVNALPELGTSVGIQGSLKQKEVGGPMCLGIVLGIIIAF